MNDRDALFRAIAADADDDTPRLVFADWLQEHGEDRRAEFIRLQCRLAGMSPHDDEWADLRQRERELTLWAGDDWLQEMPRIRGVSWERPYERGFAGQAMFQIGWGPDADDPDAVERWRRPWRRVLDESPVRDFLVTASPYNARIRFEVAPESKAVQGLVLNSIDNLTGNDGESPDLPSLRRLTLEHWRDSAAVLAELACARSLERLDLDLSLASPPEAARLFRRFAGRLSRLRELRLTGLGFDRQAVSALAAAGPFGSLLTLRLSNMILGDGGLSTLATPGMFPELANLEITSSPLGESGAGVIAGADHWRLRGLTLRGCRIGSLGTRHLTESPNLATLRELSLDGFGKDGTRHLAGSRHLAGLRSLDLRHAFLNRQTLLALAESAAERRLTRLDVGTTGNAPHDVRGKDMVDFLGRLDLPELRELNLDAMRVGAMGCRKLATRRFGELRALGLRSAGARSSSVSLLLDALDHLETLGVAEGGLSPKVRLTLQQRSIRCVG